MTWVGRKKRENGDARTACQPCARLRIQRADPTAISASISEAVRVVRSRVQVLASVRVLPRLQINPVQLVRRASCRPENDYSLIAGLPTRKIPSHRLENADQVSRVKS